MLAPKELNSIENEQWTKLSIELMNAGVTKEEFKHFLEMRRKEKNLS